MSPTTDFYYIFNECALYLLIFLHRENSLVTVMQVPFYLSNCTIEMTPICVYLYKLNKKYKIVTETFLSYDKNKIN